MKICTIVSIALLLAPVACSSSQKEQSRSWILDAVAPLDTCSEPAVSTLPTSTRCTNVGYAYDLCPGTLTSLQIWECADIDGEQRQPANVPQCTAVARPPGITQFACKVQRCQPLKDSPDCKGGEAEWSCPAGGGIASGCSIGSTDSAAGVDTVCCAK